MKKIISGILALSMISGMSGFQNVCAVESDSEITISGSTMPTGVLEEGSIFNLRGNISSRYNLKSVDAEIRLRNTDKTVQYISVIPDTTTYNIYPDIDYAMIFNELQRGSYTYILNAEDINGYKVNLIKSDFQVGNIEKIAGDSNIDGKIDVADVVAIASYVADSENNILDYMGIINADVQGDGDGLTAGDALAIQQYLAGIIGKLENKNPDVTTTSTTITTTTTTTATEKQTETSASSETSPVTLGLPEFIADSYYRCCDTTASQEDIDSMTNDIISGKYSLEEFMLNLINYKFSDGRGKNSDYAYCLYNSMLKREPSESEIS
ncbi:MAG: dockerin type I repeat-containing protein, partial [Ruminococcus sp.]|nr:dockerin type I repeat-containing protein [Ruminococcus sp.]